MSSMDYLCCKKCDGKIFYDAHDDLLDRLDDYFEGKGLLCPDCVEKVETELAEARAEIERLSSRDGNAKHELVYDDGDNPFAREKLEHVDFGVCDNQYVLESHLLNNALEGLKAKDKLIEQIKSEVERGCQGCASRAMGCRDYCLEGVVLDLIEGKDNAALAAAERMGK